MFNSSENVGVRFQFCKKAKIGTRSKQFRIADSGTGRRTYSFPLAQVNFGTLSYDLIKSHSFEVNYSLAPFGALGFFFSPLKQSVNERQGVVLIAHPKVLSLLVISSPKKVGLDPPFHLPFLL